MRHAALLLLLWAAQTVSAETVDVKYHRSVALDAFSCVDISERSDVSRVCYDAAQRYMLIRLKTTYYHYCEVDAAAVQGLLAASSKRLYFETKIRGSGTDGPFDCRTHPIPKKYQR